VVDEQLEVWEALKEDMESGKTVYGPASETQNDKKRKRGSSKEKKAKKSRRESDSLEEDDSDFQDDGSGDDTANKGSGDDEPTDESPAKPLTAEELNSKLNELRDTRKAARKQRVELEKNIHSVRNDIETIELEMDKIQGQMSALCIAGRNAYSKGAIQRDFAAGIVSLCPCHLLHFADQNTERT
jgi:chromosome segregation ATPase